MFTVIYSAIDGNGEEDREFSSLTAARAWVESMEGLLEYHGVYDADGHEVEEA